MYFIYQDFICQDFGYSLTGFSAQDLPRLESKC